MANSRKRKRSNAEEAGNTDSKGKEPARVNRKKPQRSTQLPNRDVGAQNSSTTGSSMEHRSTKERIDFDANAQRRATITAMSDELQRLEERQDVQFGTSSIVSSMGSSTTGSSITFANSTSRAQSLSPPAKETRQNHSQQGSDINVAIPGYNMQSTVMVDGPVAMPPPNHNQPSTFHRRDNTPAGLETPSQPANRAPAMSSASITNQQPSSALMPPPPLPPPKLPTPATTTVTRSPLQPPVSKPSPTTYPLTITKHQPIYVIQVSNETDHRFTGSATRGIFTSREAAAYRMQTLVNDYLGIGFQHVQKIVDPGRYGWDRKGKDVERLEEGRDAGDGVSRLWRAEHTRGSGSWEVRSVWMEEMGWGRWEAREDEDERNHEHSNKV